jgi:hypothetical protein
MKNAMKLEDINVSFQLIAIDGEVVLYSKLSGKALGEVGAIEFMGKRYVFQSFRGVAVFKEVYTLVLNDSGQPETPV